MSNPIARARTKIVATVGPACDDETRLAELARSGADVFRLNMAHGTPDEHATTLARIRRVEVQLGPLAVLVDLAGPKIRLGELPGGKIDCIEGQTLRFIRGDRPQADSDLTSNYEALVDELGVGDWVMLADGTVSLKVQHCDGQSVDCLVMQGGPIRSRQGINLPGARISAPALGPEDRERARWAAESGVDFLGLSFVRADDDVIQLKKLLAEFGSTTKVIAKIEKPQALQRLDAIVAASDGLMVARGDLGVEIDVAEVAVAQKRIIQAAARAGKPVIVATQMLESMIHSARPTRAEVTDVSNAILDGADACMLSGETAIGEHPRKAVEMLNRIARATEPLWKDRAAVSPPRQSTLSPVHTITQAVVQGTALIARRLEARLMVVVTRSGNTAQALSRQRFLTPIVGLSHDAMVTRQMCLLWSVMPLVGAPLDDREALLRFIDRRGLAEGWLAPGDRIVALAGTGLHGGVHNLCYVHEVQQPIE